MVLQYILTSEEMQEIQGVAKYQLKINKILHEGVENMKCFVFHNFNYRRIYGMGKLLKFGRVYTIYFMLFLQFFLQKLQEKQFKVICTCGNADVKAAVSNLVSKIQKL